MKSHISIPYKEPEIPQVVFWVRTHGHETSGKPCTDPALNTESTRTSEPSGDLSEPLYPGPERPWMATGE